MEIWLVKNKEMHMKNCEIIASMKVNSGGGTRSQYSFPRQKFPNIESTAA